LIGSIINLIVTRTLYSLQGIGINDLRVLGDDSLAFLFKTDFERLCTLTLVKHAKQFFNFELNEKKVKFATETGKIKFLGYAIDGFTFVREDEDWFKSVLYNEHNINTLD